MKHTTIQKIEKYVRKSGNIDYYITYKSGMERDMLSEDQLPKTAIHFMESAIVTNKAIEHPEINISHTVYRVNEEKLDSRLGVVINLLVKARDIIESVQNSKIDDTPYNFLSYALDDIENAELHVEDAKSKLTTD